MSAGVAPFANDNARRMSAGSISIFVDETSLAEVGATPGRPFSRWTPTASAAILPDGTLEDLPVSASKRRRSPDGVRTSGLTPFFGSGMGLAFLKPSIIRFQ